MDTYPEVGEASLLIFKAFQRSLKEKDDVVIQNALSQLYVMCDRVAEGIGMRGESNEK